MFFRQINTVYLRIFLGIDFGFASHQILAIVEGNCDEMQFLKMLTNKKGKMIFVSIVAILKSPCFMQFLKFIKLTS